MKDKDRRRIDRRKPGWRWLSKRMREGGVETTVVVGVAGTSTAPHGEKRGGTACSWGGASALTSSACPARATKVPHPSRRTARCWCPPRYRRWCTSCVEEATGIRLPPTFLPVLAPPGGKPRFALCVELARTRRVCLFRPTVGRQTSSFFS